MNVFDFDFPSPHLCCISKSFWHRLQSELQCQQCSNHVWIHRNLPHHRIPNPLHLPLNILLKMLSPNFSRASYLGMFRGSALLLSNSWWKSLMTEEQLERSEWCHDRKRRATEGKRWGNGKIREQNQDVIRHIKNLEERAGEMRCTGKKLGDLGSSQRSRKLKELKSRAEVALWFVKFYGLKLTCLKCVDNKHGSSHSWIWQWPIHFTHYRQRGRWEIRAGSLFTGQVLC